MSLYNKKIIGIIGPPASGKSELLKFLNQNTNTYVINLDKKTKKINKIIRKNILNTRGVGALEIFVLSRLKNSIYNEIKKCSETVIIIEGPKLKKYFKKIIDIFIEFDVPYKTREKRALKRGNTLEQFKFYNDLYKEKIK